jgi:hypothetical protein
VAWGLDRKALEAGRAEIERRMAGEPFLGDYEAMGRAHHWLDEPEPARRWLLDAAERLEAVERERPGSAGSWGRIGGIRRLAGDEAGARPWFERALAAREAEGRTGWIAGLRYILGDDAGALEAAALDPDQLPELRGVAALAQARAARDARPIADARERFATAIRAERVPPYDESGADLTLFDWLEESYRLESELTGGPPPDHVGMLQGAGLLKAAKPRRRGAPDNPPSRGTRIAQGASTLEVDDDGDVFITVDPTVRVALLKELGEWRVRITLGPEEEGPQEEDLPQRYKGFVEAAEAAADFLRAYGPPGAAETLLALAS